MESKTYIERSSDNGKYIAFVMGHKVGEYSNITRALQKMAKYAKSQNL